jgi:hypothetical protein
MSNGIRQSFTKSDSRVLAHPWSDLNTYIGSKEAVTDMDWFATRESTIKRCRAAGELGPDDEGEFEFPPNILHAINALSFLVPEDDDAVNVLPEENARSDSDRDAMDDPEDVRIQRASIQRFPEVDIKIVKTHDNLKSKAPCEQARYDAFYDVDFRTEIENLTWSVLLPDDLSQTPWRYSSEVPAKEWFLSLGCITYQGLEEYSALKDVAV